ncbi:MAG: hypothetical protein QME58_13395 [Bacteroidota bacterium]|nr:hypothetical protein [Bacteroidota bacterium]
MGQVLIRDTVVIGKTDLKYNKGVLSGTSTNIGPIYLPEVDCGSITTDLDGMYDDNILIPRWGGILGIAFDNRWGHAGDGNHNGVGDRFLVYDISGSLIGSYVFEPEMYDTVVVFGDTIVYPIMQVFIPVRQWNLLRFRLYIKRFDEQPDGTFKDKILKPNYPVMDTIRASYITNYPPNPIPLHLSMPTYRHTGRIVFRSREPFHYGMGLITDYANVYLLRYTSIDSTPATMLPPTSGPPYTGTPIILPYEGTYRLIVTGGSNAHDDLIMISPDTATILTDAQNHIGDTVIIGPYPAGTQLQLGIVSHTGLWSGRTTYPCVTQYLLADWGMSFEGWTDLLFDELGVRLEWNAGVADHLELFTIPKVIDYGDTVDLQIRAVDSTGKFVPLESTYLFTIAMRDTNSYGYLMMDGVVDTFFYVWADSGVGKGLQFAATGTVPKDTVVEIPFYLTAINYAEVQPSKAGRMKIGMKISEPQPDSIFSETTKPVKMREILLGETKYYNARIVNGELQIEEFAEAQSTGLTSVNFTVEKYLSTDQRPNGKRLGVYYEYRDDKGVKFDSTRQIRLIGRYWSSDSVYLVRLTAKYHGKEDSRIIEVKKPNKLGNKHHTAIDVFNNQYNLDSVIIFHAGVEGIPPQLLKGQIEKESSFRPSYNYEPFTDASEVQGKNWLARMKNNPYWIDSTGVGYNTLPSNHSYLWRIGTQIQYPNSVQTIWDYYNGRPHYYPKEIYSIINKVWNNTLRDPRTRELIDSGLSAFESVAQATHFANDSLPGYLRDSFKGGLINMIAQTRISSSYGLLQLVYFYGVMNTIQYQYPESQSHLPEKLNEVDTSFIYAIKHLKMLFNYKKIKENSTASTGWKQGYGGTFKAVIGQYNTSNKYVIDVFKYSKNYLPIR